MNIPLERIGLVGASSGASYVLEAALMQNKLGFVIADSPYLSFEDALHKKYAQDYGMIGRFLLIPIKFIFYKSLGISSAETIGPQQKLKHMLVPSLIFDSSRSSFYPKQKLDSVKMLDNPKIKISQSHWNSRAINSDNYFEKREDFINIINKFINNMLSQAKPNAKQPVQAHQKAPIH